MECLPIRCSKHVKVNGNKRLTPVPLHLPRGQPAAAGTARLLPACQVGLSGTARFE